MASVLGFRVEKRVVHWAVIGGDCSSPTLLAADVLKLPKAYDESAGLKWLRERVITLIGTYQPSSAVVRTIEPNARATHALFPRVRMEGVLLESCLTSGVSASLSTLTTMTSKLDSSSAKAYLDQDELRELDWSAQSKEMREAILAAASELEG